MKKLVLVLLTVAVSAISCSQGQQSAEKPAADETVQNIWTVGIYTGPSPFELGQPAEIVNPVLTGADATDMELNIVAHPFMLIRDGKYYMFFTAKNDVEHTDAICSAVSDDGLHWKYHRAVIDVAYDLAYPFVFEWQGEIYMTPEAHTEQGLQLYKAVEFPDKWEFVQDLIPGDTYISPTPFRYDEKWWLYACVTGNETLRLFYADDLLGPWTEHPMSPIVEKDLNTARPAGRPLVIDGQLYRLGQDCDPTYGNAVNAFKVIELTTTTYLEEIVEGSLAAKTGQGWNSEAMHHVDAQEIAPGKWIAAVDALGAPVEK